MNWNDGKTANDILQDVLDMKKKIEEATGIDEHIMKKEDLAEELQKLMEKARKYDEIAETLWNNVFYGNLAQQTICAMLIRQFKITTDEHDDPDSV